MPHHLIAIAAPVAENGISGGQILGSVSASGLALSGAYAMILGIRGSDRITLQKRDHAGIAGFATGTLFVVAGGMWASIANNVSSVPTSVIGSGGVLGNPGLGGIALFTTVFTFCPRWKRMIWPALGGIAASVIYGNAGGGWGVLVNLVRMGIGRLTGAA